jgi:hypothetical protein
MKSTQWLLRSLALIVKIGNLKYVHNVLGSRPSVKC